MNFNKKTIGVLAFSIGVIVMALYFYPKIVYSFYGEFPISWTANLHSLNHKKIIENLGIPDEDLSAKGYQSWLKRTWWGVYQLHIDFRDCCSDQSMPEDIFIVVRVNGRYEPVDIKQLMRQGD